MQFEPFEPKRHDRASFDCGVAELNTYLKRYASQDQKRQLTRVCVLSDSDRIIGFYSLIAHSIQRDNLPKSLKLGGYDALPFLMLGRLAVDKKDQGQGFGDALIFHALKSTVAAAEHIGLIGLIVDAKNESAASFYEGFGFIRLEETPNRLVLPFTAIKKLLQQVC
jgi:GNAT superfamily N-acetyltransferase